MDTFNEKRKCCYHRCPDTFYFDTLFLIIYLRAIETLICCREMGLIWSTSSGFKQNTMHDFLKYRIELIVAVSSTNATKTAMNRVMKKSAMSALYCLNNESKYLSLELPKRLKINMYSVTH